MDLSGPSTGDSSLSDALRRDDGAGTLAGRTRKRASNEIIGGLADISSDTLQILAILRGEDEEENDDEEMDS